MTFVVALACGVVAAAGTHFMLVRLIPATPLRRPNYRGILVPTGLGITVLAGLMGGAGFLALLHGVFPTARVVAEPGAPTILILAGAAGFGVLGLFDDIAAGAERGFRAHIEGLRQGRLTSGALKLLAGMALALAIAAPGATSFGYALVGGAVIALSANLFNGLDVRPGRAGKFFVIAALGLFIAGSAFRPALAAGIGAVAAFLPADMRERAMLGDAGANALGAIVGVAIVYESSGAVSVIVLAVLAVLTIVAEGPTLSKAIEAFPPLAALDKLGRVDESEKTPVP